MFWYIFDENDFIIMNEVVLDVKQQLEYIVAMFK